VPGCTETGQGSAALIRLFQDADSRHSNSMVSQCDMKRNASSSQGHIPVERTGVQWLFGKATNREGVAIGSDMNVVTCCWGLLMSS